MTTRGPFFYRVQLTKGGAWVGLKLWRSFPTDPDTDEVLTERPQLWRAVLNGEEKPVEEVYAVLFTDAADPVVKGEPISALDYQLLTEDRAWCREYAPQSPEANPRKRINLNDLPPLKFTA